MKRLAILTALTLAACQADPTPYAGQRSAWDDALIFGAMMSRPTYSMPAPPPMLPQTVTYQRMGPGTVMAY